MCVLLGILFGCGGGRLEREAAADRMNRANHYLETVQSLELSDAYPELTGSAESSLAAAREALAAENPAAAIQAADASGAAAREALRRYYRDTVARLARRAREALAARDRLDPEDPLVRERSAINGILDGGETADNASPLDAVRRVLADLEMVLAVSDSLRRSWRRTLAVDDAFRPGGDELSPLGRETLTALAEEIQATIAGTLESAGAPKGLLVKVVGYTDALNFGRGTPLVARLTEGVEFETPEVDPDRRRFLNQRLSRFRAEAASRALAEVLKEMALGPISVEAVGRGEEIPSGVSPPHPPADPRRRICRIFVHVVSR
ncbi:MAG: hypothetical protein ACLFRG_04660 [Desulfococcaceae bacterium]